MSPLIPNSASTWTLVTALLPARTVVLVAGGVRVDLRACLDVLEKTDISCPYRDSNLGSCSL